MNSDFSDSLDPTLLQLERELQSLTPTAPGRELMRSLQERMEPVIPPPQANKVHTFPWRRMVAPAAAAAAAVAVMSINNRRGTTPGKTVAEDHATETPPVIKWEPMPMRREYRSLKDAGYYYVDENLTPVRQYLMDAVDQHEWRNSEDNSSIRLMIPRQGHILVPAAGVMPAGVENEGAVRTVHFQ